MKRSRIGLFSASVFALACAMTAGSVQANTMWQWSYSGTGINASGSLITADTPDTNGFYQILSIAGSRNGDAIVGLYPTGQAIPGNEPFAIDNLIRIDGPGQITVEGFGYALASGAHANPYFADFLSPPSYSEVFTQGATFNEQPIEFTASSVPEPSSIALVVLGLATVALTRLAQRRDA